MDRLPGRLDFLTFSLVRDSLKVVPSYSKKEGKWIRKETQFVIKQ